MSKKMCKDRDEIKVRKDKKPAYKCKACGETALKEKYLCKPKKI
jgi:hypothetical protein